MKYIGIKALIALGIPILMLLTTVALPVMAAEETAGEGGWQFTAAPYMWVASLGMITASGSDVEIEFSDIIENLDMTFMGIFGVHKGKWSVNADVMYLNMSKDDISFNAAIPVGPLGRSTAYFEVDADVEMTSWILTPAVSYRVIQNEKVSMYAVGGVRYLYLKSDAKLDITGELDTQLLQQGIIRTGEVSDRLIESDGMWDGIIGIRGAVNLNDKWYIPYYGDIGTGDTDLTWQVYGGVGYRYSRFDVVAGYRYMAWEFDDPPFDSLDVSGPFIGARFSF
jgi:hypothetical protein